MDTDGATIECDLNVGIGGNIHRRHIEVKGVRVAEVDADPPYADRVTEFLSSKIHDDDYSNQAENANDQEDFAGGEPSGRAALALRGGAFVKVEKAPTNEHESAASA